MVYYAIHKGYIPGIYLSWEKCKKNVLGFNGAIFKKFTNKEDAEYFYNYGKQFNDNKIGNVNNKITVYTDGACSNNGYNNAKSGIGIFFGENDKRNISKKLHGLHTNNIAELTAIFEVSKILSSEINSGLNIEICTDSTYAIKCCTTYGEKQEKLKWSKNIPNKKLVKKIYNTFKKYPNVTFKHIKAHTNKNDIDSINNANADKLATNAIKKN